MAAARAPAVRAELNGLAGGATASPSATQSSGGGGAGAGVFGRCGGDDSLRLSDGGRSAGHIITRSVWTGCVRIVCGCSNVNSVTMGAVVVVTCFITSHSGQRSSPGQKRWRTWSPSRLANIFQRMQADP